jgi:hypothetical protein
VSQGGGHERAARLRIGSAHEASAGLGVPPTIW